MFAKLSGPYLPLLPNRTYTIYRLNIHSDEATERRESNTITSEEFSHQGKHATEVTPTMNRVEPEFSSFASSVT
jgi:hypothetical protein